MGKMNYKLSDMGYMMRVSLDLSDLCLRNRYGTNPKQSFLQGQSTGDEMGDHPEIDHQAMAAMAMFVLEN